MHPRYRPDACAQGTWAMFARVVLLHEARDVARDAVVVVDAMNAAVHLHELRRGNCACRRGRRRDARCGCGPECCRGGGAAPVGLFCCCCCCVIICGRLSVRWSSSFLLLLLRRRRRLGRVRGARDERSSTLLSSKACSRIIILGARSRGDGCMCHGRRRTSKRASRRSRGGLPPLIKRSCHLYIYRCCR